MTGGFTKGELTGGVVGGGVEETGAAGDFGGCLLLFRVDEGGRAVAVEEGVEVGAVGESVEGGVVEVWDSLRASSRSRSRRLMVALSISRSVLRDWMVTFWAVEVGSPPLSDSLLSLVGRLSGGCVDSSLG